VKKDREWETDGNVHFYELRAVGEQQIGQGCEHIVVEIPDIN
jgi:hypothetical protein